MNFFGSIIFMIANNQILVFSCQLSCSLSQYLWDLQVLQISGSLSFYFTMTADHELIINGSLK